MAMAELCLDVTAAWNVVLAVWMRLGLGTLLPSKDHGESLCFAVRLCIVRVRVRVRVWGTLVKVRVWVTLLASTSSEYQV